ncbi:hypothetical protein EDS67_28885 [candidate division KSB1 bacterium]|nr:MAG: hypothetical protein EDS67_28885 [candidate division KSB1 bacterium]
MKDRIATWANCDGFEVSLIAFSIEQSRKKRFGVIVKTLVRDGPNIIMNSAILKAFLHTRTTRGAIPKSWCSKYVTLRGFILFFLAIFL